LTPAFRPSLVCLLSLISTAASSHEYWLDAVDPSISSEQKIIVDIRNGENFVGAAFPYNPDNFTSLDISYNGKTEPYSGRLGDYPALHKTPTEAGIYAFTVNSAESSLEYTTWHKFKNFLDYHALDAIEEAHKSRGLPNSNIKELYRRNAKTLLRVDHTSPAKNALATPEDLATKNAAFELTGADFEMRLLDNPYSEIKELRVQLMLDGKPLPNRQAEMFWRGDQMFRFTQKSDAEGIATFKLLADGEYMFNAVHVSEALSSDDAHWISLWASITFEREGFGKL